MVDRTDKLVIAGLVAWKRLFVIVCTSAPERAPAEVPVMAKPPDVEALFEALKGYARK